MSRIPDRFCDKCGSLMRRLYVRPPNWSRTPIGFVCACENIDFDWSDGVKKWVGNE